MNKYANMIAVLFSAAIGWIAWGSDAPDWMQALTVFVPALWCFSTTRLMAGIVVSVYAMAASRGLIVGIANYFDSTWFFGFTLWCLAGFFLGLIGLIFWRKEKRQRMLLIPVFLLAWILPPFGLLGWANPITSAGWMFSGMAWLGLGLTVLLMMLIAASSARWNLLFFLPLILVIAFYGNSEPIKANSYQGIDTSFHFGAGDKEASAMDEIQRHWQLQSLVNEIDAEVVVLPESVGGKWNEHAADEWKRSLIETPKKKVLMGAFNKNENNMVLVGAYFSKIVYKQRNPIPVGMWRPWANNSTEGAFFNGDQVIEIDNKKVAILLCHEAVITWTVFYSMLNKPDIIVSVGSTWWAGETINKIQRQASKAWSKLFNVSLVEAYNL